MGNSSALRRKNFKVRQTWIDDLHRRPKVSPCEKLVGTRLAWHQNLVTGECFPSVTTLAAETGMPERSVYRALDGLKSKGRIKKKSGERGRSNRYFLVPPPPDIMSGVPLTPRHLTPCQANYETPKKERNGGGGLAPPSQASPPPAHGGAPYVAPCAGERACEEAPTPLEQAQAEPPDDREELVQEEASPVQEEASDTAIQIEAKWRELRGSYVRPWPETPQEVATTRNLFFKLVREGADPAAILDGARAWGAAFAEKPDKLRPLWKWLKASGWESVPPVKQQRAMRPKDQRDKAQRMTPARAMANLVNELRGS